VNSESDGSPRWYEVLTAIAFSVSAFVFFTLSVGDYLVFASSPLIQGIGSEFLTPVSFLSVVVLHTAPFDEGLWAFSAFCVMMLSTVGLMSRRRGLGRAFFDVLTAVAPVTLLVFEIGVYLFIPRYFFSPVTNFVGGSGIAEVLTNYAVMLVSLFLLCFWVGFALWRHFQLLRTKA
jgi:hypothetical protein